MNYPHFCSLRVAELLISFVSQFRAFIILTFSVSDKKPTQDGVWKKYGGRSGITVIDLLEKGIQE